MVIVIEGFADMMVIDYMMVFIVKSDKVIIKERN